MPGAIEPEQRELRFGDPLDAELRVSGIGYISGGGSLLSAPDENDQCEIVYAGVDVDTINVDAARTLLRDHLPELGCPAGTRVQSAISRIGTMARNGISKNNVTKTSDP